MRAGAASLLVGGVVEQLLSPSLFAQSTLTPDQALRKLMDGNAHYVADKLTDCCHDLKAQRQQTLDKQEPFAAVLSCADSRVAVELVFDEGLGRIFVTRVAGNVATSEIIGSLEYGVAVLGTPLILVLGHANCGAVKAAMQGKAVPGQISSLFPHIQAAVDADPSHDLEKTIKLNAKIQAALLRKSSPVLSAAVVDGKLKVEAAYYDLASGQVTLVDA